MSAQSTANPTPEEILELMRSKNPVDTYHDQMKGFSKDDTPSTGDGTTP